jgi:SAM-dependent MidA family methyltransferase
MTALHRLILDRIRREGPITFADYMRMALYEPGLGYYVTGASSIGWQGADYFTSTDINDFFAHCMGRQLLRMWEQLRRPTPFLVLEQGAGRGALAEAVRAWAWQEAPDFSAALDYRVADIRTGQDAQALEAAPPGDGDSPSVLLSNELVDAFPVHIVELRQGQLCEVYVGEVKGQEGQLCEMLGAPCAPEVAAYLDRFRVSWRGYPSGWRAEINLDALRWIGRCARVLRRGYLLIIDYGEKARALYTPDRTRGTLLCYYRHQANERPVAHPGEQDITAHVNFSALIDEGRRHGLHLNTYTTQRAWLERMGLQDELEQRYTREFAPALANRASDEGQVALLQWRSLRQGVSVLTNPAGMGNFKVLVMRR